MRTLIFSLILSLALLASLLVNVTSIQAADCTPTANGVCLLQPDIIQQDQNFEEASLGHYLSLLFNTLIGLAGGISVLIIVVSGLQYIISEVPGVKTGAKGRITEALVGLVLALSAYLILYTINPDLVNLDLRLKPLNTSSQTTPK